MSAGLGGEAGAGQALEGSGGGGGGGPPPPPVPGQGTLEFDAIRVGPGTRLNTFVTTGLPQSTIAYVGNDTVAKLRSVHDYFSLRYGEALTPDNITVVNSPTFAVDGAQWVRMLVPDQSAAEKLFWSVDPQNVSTFAHDENAGWGATEAAADLRPLATMQELNRRLAGGVDDIPLVIHLLSSPDAASFAVLQNLQTRLGTTNFVTVKGNLFLPSPAADHRTVTAVQLAAFTPAPGLERTITIGGFDDVAAFVGLFVRTVDGSKTAVVTRKVAPNVLAIGEPRSSDELGNAGAIVDFAPLDTVSFFDATRLCDWPFPTTGCPYPLLVWFRMDADGSGHYPQGQIGSQTPTVGQVLWGDAAKQGLLSFDIEVASQGYVTTYSCGMSGQHQNTFHGGNFYNQSLTVLVGGDGPLIHTSNWEFSGELNITAVLGGPAFRQVSGGPFNAFFAGDNAASAIACWGATLTAAFDMWQPNHAPSGNFVVRPGNVGPTNFKWYGDAGTGIPALRLLTLGAGTKSQLPFSAARLTVQTGGQKPICIDGVDFDFADVPITTLSGATLADGTGNTSSNALNRGKFLVGGTTCVSWGDQSPAADAVALAWRVGDFRAAVGAALAAGIAGWRGSVAGTPGTWAQIDQAAAQAYRALGAIVENGAENREGLDEPVAAPGPGLVLTSPPAAGGVRQLGEAFFPYEYPDDEPVMWPGRGLVRVPGLAMDVVVLTGSGTYTPPPGSTIIVEGRGGTGGGGGAIAAAAGNMSIASGGGTGGGFRKKYVNPGACTYACGAAGAAGANTGAVAGTGGDTTFTDGTTLCTAKGGVGAPAGIGNTAANGVVVGGAGGAISTGGDQNWGGQQGYSAMCTGGGGVAGRAISGGGGGLGGGDGLGAAGAGTAAKSVGGGGGGALALTGTGPFAGGAGFAGEILVWVILPMY